MTESNAIHTPNWYVIQTRFQKEKTADEQLRNQSIQTLYPRDEKRDSRRRPVINPFFPRYLFAQFALWQLSQVRSTRGVMRVVEFIQGQPIAVDDWIIASLARQMRPDGVVMLEDTPITQSGYRVDDQVMITFGPLSGMAGLYRRDLGDGERVMLLLKMLGREFERPVLMRDTRPLMLDELAYT